MTRPAIIAAVFACLVASAVADDLLVFTRKGCGPCDQAKAAIEADRSITIGYTLRMVDTGDEPAEARRYGVRSVPTFVVVRDGREVRRTTGFSSADKLRAWLDQKGRRRRR